MRWINLDKEYLGLLAALLVATLSVNSMPLLVGSTISGLNLNAANAGLMASVELGAVALTTLCVSRKLSAFSLPSLGLWGGVLAFLGNMSCWLTLIRPHSAFALLTLNGQVLDGASGVLVLGRAIAGMGAGAALAAFSGAIACVSEPDRKYAKLLVANVAVIGLSMATLIPCLQQHFSYRGTFTALAFLDLAAIACMWHLPAPTPHHGNGTTPLKNKLAGTLLIVSLSVFAVGEGAVWAFVEQVGQTIQFNRNIWSAELSSVIGIASMLGVGVGAGAAAVLGLRYGRRVPLFLALLIFGIAGPLLSSCTSHAAYVLLIFNFIMSQYFLFPYYMGAATELDDTGQWAAASTGMYLLGSTVGPVAAGQLITATSSFRSVGWMVLATSMVPMLMMYAVFSIQRKKVDL